LSETVSSIAMNRIFVFLLVGLLAPLISFAATDQPANPETSLLTNIRQVTFTGRRAGEGYFSQDGSRLIFQSERDADNPFFQIYLMDLRTGDTQRVSPGYGKTTCAWIHPSGEKVLFASSHLDPQARDKQKQELELRATGKERRYSWDYDEYFDIFETDLQGKQLTNMTNTRGYDAEASWSPDGKLIVFSSNRHAYTEPLSEEAAVLFEHDPGALLDLYVMNADGTNVRRLTDTLGTDGGAFFSPDGTRIVWRRFAPDGATAEIFTMNIDGANQGFGQRQITSLGAMSWAPYFHPSGDYLIFATNMQGFANFELYLVDSQGTAEPVRVTHTDGFDGLPVFAPDGAQLAWTTTRTSTKQSQIFFADWNDAAARKLLGLDAPSQGTAAAAAVAVLDATGAEIRADDLQRHIEILASEDMAGRLTGTAGEQAATAYVASIFEGLGLSPAGDDDTFFQAFPFTAGVSLGPDNALALSGKATAQGQATPEARPAYRVDQDWRPLTFSKTGAFDPAGVVFAGYGIVAPAADGHPAYDSYTHLDVQDKWVFVFRYLPEGISQEFRQHLSRYASLRRKAMLARDHGARGLIVVSGPNAKVKSQLVSLSFDASLAGTSIGALSVTDAVASAWLQSVGKDLQTLQATLDSGEPMMGFGLGDLSLGANIDIQQEKKTGRNVLARLAVDATPSPSRVASLILGAHIDHLGTGHGANSLARGEEKGGIHYGADDNASGVAGLLEIAQFLAAQKASGQLSLQRDIVFAAWSGEEMGLLGSSHFTRTFRGKGDEPTTLRPEVVAYLNMDMIGRLDTNLVLQGIGSSPVWTGLIEQYNVPIGLSITLQNDSYLPTDATSFYLKKVPVLSAFTGAHEDYHTPRDTADKINAAGAEQIVRLMAAVTKNIATREDVPEYREMDKPAGGIGRVSLRAYLGTIPDYAQGDIVGVKLSGVVKGGPAEQAGLQGGDIILELAGKKIENIYDYTYALDALSIDTPAEIVVQRQGEQEEQTEREQRVVLSITPGSRE
jgi:Tol biopolymer transport system component